MRQYLIVERKGPIGVVRFNRPEQLNAMNRVFMDEIIDAFAELNRDDGVGAVVVTGNGRAFMAGADIKEYAAQTDEQFLAFQERGWELYKQAERGSKPFVAMVNGYALGGGFEIVCACDLVVASEDAKFGLPEVHLGLIPGGGGTQRLVQKIGINRVRQMLYLGDQYTAAQMRDWGIVNYVVAAEELEPFCLELAAKLSRRSPEALAQLKRLACLSTEPLSLDDRMRVEGAELLRLFRTPQAREKIDAFVEKSRQ